MFSFLFDLQRCFELECSPFQKKRRIRNFTPFEIFYHLHQQANKYIIPFWLHINESGLFLFISQKAPHMPYAFVPTADASKIYYYTFDIADGYEHYT